MMSLVSRRKETEVGGSSTSGKGGPSLPAARGPVPKACTVVTTVLCCDPITSTARLTALKSASCTKPAECPPCGAAGAFGTGSS